MYPSNTKKQNKKSSVTLQRKQVAKLKRGKAADVNVLTGQHVLNKLCILFLSLQHVGQCDVILGHIDLDFLSIVKDLKITMTEV